MAAALDIVGDRWTLCVLRDVIIKGPVRFKELCEAEENIATNVLTSRIRGLQADGLIKARRYQAHPPRYEYVATPKGLDMFPVLQALATWAQTHIRGVSQERYELG